MESNVERKQSRIITVKEFLKFRIITFINVEIFIKDLPVETDIYHSSDINTLPADFFSKTQKNKACI